MKYDKNIQLLKDIGLNDNEIVVYLVLLEHESLAIKKLLSLTKIKRGNLYNTLYLLENKELVEEFDKDKVKHFRAHTPENLKKLAIKKKQSVENTIDGIDKIIPQFLQTFHLSSSKPAVYYYEGLEGVKIVYDKILYEKKHLNIFTSIYERQNPEYVKILVDQISKQKKLGLKVRSISGKYFKMHEYLKILSNNASSRTIDGMKMESEIYIFGTNVAIVTFKKSDYFTTIITNENIAQTMLTIFEALWALGKDPKTYIN